MCTVNLNISGVLQVAAACMSLYDGPICIWLTIVVMVAHVEVADTCRHSVEGRVRKRAILHRC